MAGSAAVDTATALDVVHGLARRHHDLAGMVGDQRRRDLLRACIDGIATSAHGAVVALRSAGRTWRRVELAEVCGDGVWLAVDTAGDLTHVRAMLSTSADVHERCGLAVVGVVGPGPPGEAALRRDALAALGDTRST